MKKINLLVIAFIAMLTFTNSNCKKNKTEVCYSSSSTGRIIGFDLCRNYGSYGKVNGAGFVIERIVNTVKDTVVCYDIPESLFTFQNSYLNTGYSSFLFEPTTQNLFKIGFYFKDLTDLEKTIIFCNPLVSNADFYAATKGKEIKISCITKL